MRTPSHIIDMLQRDEVVKSDLSRPRVWVTKETIDASSRAGSHESKYTRPEKITYKGRANKVMKDRLDECILNAKRKYGQAIQEIIVRQDNMTIEIIFKK